MKLSAEKNLFISLPAMMMASGSPRIDEPARADTETGGAVSFRYNQRTQSDYSLWQATTRLIR
jgi:hypothetical protein